MDTQLVVIESDVPLADSRKVAFELGMEHKNFRELLQDKQDYIEKYFGFLRFTTAKLDGRGRPEKYILLTEEQSYYALTFSENTPKAMELRAKLIKAFMEARQGLTQLTITPLAGEISPDVLADPRRLTLAIRSARSLRTYLESELALRYPDRARISMKRVRGPQDVQERILHVVRRHGPISLNTLHHSYMKRWDVESIEKGVETLLTSGQIVRLQTERGWTKYAVA